MIPRNAPRTEQVQLVFDWAQARSAAQRLAGTLERIAVVTDAIERITPELAEARATAGLDDLAAARRDRIKQLAEDDSACQDLAGQIKDIRKAVRRTNAHQELRAQRAALKELQAEYARDSAEMIRAVANAGR